MRFPEVPWFLPASLVAFVLMGPVSALANTLSATGGLQFGRNSGMNDLRNTNPLLGASYSFDLGAHLEIGGFYDYNFLTFQDGSAGSLAFMGMLVRYQAKRDQGLFGEMKFGMGQVSNSNLVMHSLLSYGVGAGYRFPITTRLSAGPRVDLRDLPQSIDPSSGRSAMTDFSLMISLKLP